MSKAICTATVFVGLAGTVVAALYFGFAIEIPVYLGDGVTVYTPLGLIVAVGYLILLLLYGLVPYAWDLASDICSALRERFGRES